MLVCFFVFFDVNRNGVSGVFSVDKGIRRRVVFGGAGRFYRGRFPFLNFAGVW